MKRKKRFSISLTLLVTHYVLYTHILYVRWISQIFAYFSAFTIKATHSQRVQNRNNQSESIAVEVDIIKKKFSRFVLFYVLHTFIWNMQIFLLLCVVMFHVLCLLKSENLIHEKHSCLPNCTWWCTCASYVCMCLCIHINSKSLFS